MARKRLSGRTRTLIVCALVVLGVYLLAVTPVRTYLDQQDQMDTAQARYDELRETNDELRQRAGRLMTDEEIARIARERYELVTPGAQAYAVMPPAVPAPPEVENNESLWDKINFLN